MLGIYFGPQVVSVVESKGKSPGKYFHLAQPVLSLEEKVPAHIKLAAMIKEAMTQNGIEPAEAIVSISGKDLIVRTFEMPILPAQELNSAVNFEAKKYIPFKVEELFSDFEYKLDKTVQKTRVLFVGIKKEALNNYLEVLRQLGVRPRSVEYSAFSILRLLKLANIREKDIIAVVNIDLLKEDEANFVVLEGGFPLFSRDISLMGGYEEPAKVEESERNTLLEKLKREIQISLDYYDRKFPGKNILKIFFITNPNYRAELEGFVKDLGLSVNFIDINKHINRPIPFSLPFVKSFSGSLSMINTGVKINLLSAKERVTKKEAKELPVSPSLIANYKPELITAAVCLLVYISVFAFSSRRMAPLENEIKGIVSMRPEAPRAISGLSYDELLKIKSGYDIKARTMEGILKERVVLTPLFDSIPRVVLKGMNLEMISFKKAGEKKELTLNGSAYSGNIDKQRELINIFLTRLKENPVIAKYFQEVGLVSSGTQESEEIISTYFAISCGSAGSKKGK